MPLGEVTQIAIFSPASKPVPLMAKVSPRFTCLVVTVNVADAALTGLATNRVITIPSIKKVTARISLTFKAGWR